MRTLHLDCSSGVSGDMWLGALIDAGASLEAVQAAVEALGVGNVRITMGRVRRAGVQATSVRVRAPQETPPLGTWERIERTLEYAAVDDDLRHRAQAVFKRLVTAEAEAHGIEPEEVEFHEIGALDTIADVVGTAAALASLRVERVTCGPITVGSGEVETAHGRIPLPRPAVTTLLRGYPVQGGDAGVELTTATGAALIAELATPVPALPAMTLEAVGVGAGAADLASPNVLRAFLGVETDDTPSGEASDG